MIGDFQNALISGIFPVFWSGFLHRTTLNDLYNGFSHVFWNFNFLAKVRLLPRLKPLHDGRFSKCSNFWNMSCFLERFFAQNNSK